MFDLNTTGITYLFGLVKDNDFNILKALQYCYYLKCLQMNG